MGTVGTRTLSGRACTLAIGATLLAAGTAEAAVMSFLDQEVQLSEFQVDPAFATPLGTETVGDALEFDNVGTFINFDIDIGDRTIDLMSNVSLPPASGFSIGFTFADPEDTIAPFASVAVTSSEGYTGIVPTTVRLSDDRDMIIVDFDGVGFGSGRTLSLEVEFQDDATPVIPLPATLPLALGGVGALAAIGRRRRA